MSSKLPRYLLTASGAYALVGGTAAFLGWATGTYRLTDWTGSGISIKANAALAVMMASAALLLVAAGSARWIVRVLGMLVALIGGLTLFEHLAGVPLGIDTLLFDEPPGAGATVAPGRMGPPASVSFLAIGSALVLLTGSPRERAISVALGIAVLPISALSLVGYWFGAELMYAVPRLTGIAAPTGSFLFALGIGVIAASPDRQPLRTLTEDSPAGTLARRLVPFAVGVPLILGWLRMRGEELGLYDSEFGTALRSLLEAAILLALLWWSLRAIRVQDAQRRHAEQELREADRRKDAFIATLAHELRNPLAPIGNAASVLLRTELPQTTRWASEVIDRQVRHMVRLLEDLLDVSRISLNRLELRKERVELATIIRSAVETSRPLIEAAAHELALDLPREQIYVEADAVRLAQVFSNLLNNAAKYTERGGHIRLSARGEDAQAVVSVKDDGIGMPPDVLPRIFDLFAQAKPILNRTHEGLGIGLWLTRGIVELHGGQIDARSAGLGQGSEFVVWLPSTAQVSGQVSSAT